MSHKAHNNSCVLYRIMPRYIAEILLKLALNTNQSICHVYITLSISTLSSDISRSLPVVLLRNMVPIRSFHGSWYRLSCTRLNGDFGGVHFTSLCSSGRGINRPLTKYLLSNVDSSVGLKSASESEKKMLIRYTCIIIYI